MNIKKRFLNFFIFLFVVSLITFSILPGLASADGMMIKYDPYADRWDYLDESSQQAFINYEKGLQKMIISIGFDGKNNEESVWLFPVPADPEKVVIDVVKSLPQLRGEEISKKAKFNLDETQDLLLGSQIYTYPFLLFSGSVTNSTGRDTSFKSMNSNGFQGIEQDVIVYEHLEKEGMISEIITAKTADGLYNYLKNKKLKIESGSIPVLDYYIGKEFSFIVSWMNPSQKSTATQRGIFVTFPTEDIYFPMLPTSVYGNKIIPATIRVINYVSPKIFSDIKSYIKTEYYVDNSINFGDALKAFYNGSNKNVKYTKIEINAPSKFLTSDLWISKRAPLKTYYSLFVSEHPLINSFILLIISSLITGLLVGWIIFKKLRKDISKLGLIGLSNCLSIIGLLITTILIRTKEKTEGIDVLIMQIKQKSYLWKRKLALILLLIDFPFLLIQLFTIPNLINNISRYLKYGKSYGSLFELMIVLIPIAVFIFALIIKRIKKKDKYLFEELRLKEYSTWTFQPKDSAKVRFVFVYSISFLIISVLIVQLIKFII